MQQILFSIECLPHFHGRNHLHQNSLELTFTPTSPWLSKVKVKAVKTRLIFLFVQIAHETLKLTLFFFFFFSNRFLKQT